MKKNLKFFMVFLLYFCATINVQSQNGVSNSPLTPPSATLPYSCDFSDPSETQNWIISNGTATNKWVIGTPTNPQTSIQNEALFISNDAVFTNAYSLTATSTVVASRIIEFTGAEEYVLSFDLYIGGESSYDYLRVFIADVDSVFEGTNSTPYYGTASYTGNTQLLYSYNNLATYFNGYNGNIVVAGSYPKQLIIPNQGPAGTAKKLIFVWKNDASGGTQPPASIDNITLVETTCPRPNSLVASNVAFNSFDLSWTEPASATNWIIEYGPVGFSLGAGTILNVQNTPTYTISGLNPGVAYQFYVQSDCGSGSLSFTSIPITVTTIPLAAVPYIEGFTTTPPYGFTTTGWNIGTARGVMGNPGNNIYKNIFSNNPTGSFSTSNIGPIVTGMELSYEYIFADYSSPYAPPAIGSGKFYLSISTDLGVTYTIIDSVENNGIAGYQPKLIDLSAYDTQIVKFKVDAIWFAGDIDLAFDNFRVGLPIVCQKPTQLSTSNITFDSFNFHWHENGTATNWNIEYGPAGFSQGSGTMINASVDTFATISGLSNGSAYQIYIQTDCGGGTLSDWSDPITVNTLPLAAVPYLQAFNNTTTPQGYSITGWTISSITAVAGNPANNIYKNLYSTYPTGSFSTLNIGPVDAGMSLSFDYKHANYGSPYDAPISGTGKFFVAISNDLGITYSIIDSVENNGVDGYQLRMYDLSNYVGDNIKIKFDAQWFSGDYYLAFDNISVDYTPTCPKPTALVVSNITTSSAAINWTENGTAMEWMIEYGPVGFTQGNGTIMNTTAYPFNLQNLTPNTQYQVYVAADCGSGLLSEYSLPITFTTQGLSAVPYLESFNTTSIPSGYATTGWNIGSVRGVTGNPANNIFKNLFGSTNTSSFVSTNVGPVASNMVLTFDYKFSDYSTPYNPPVVGSGNFIVAISTDWGATYTDIDTVENSTLPGYLIFNYDLAAYVGQTIKIKITGNSFLGDFDLGFDNIKVDLPVLCPKPTALIATNVTQNSADLSWTENGTANNWNIEFGPAGFTQGNGTTVITPSNPFTLNALQNGTCYDFYVQADCGSGSVSDWSLKGSFCTAQTPVNVPFTIDFETTSGFQFANNPAGNAWAIGDATNNTTAGQNAMYVSNDNGVTNGYNDASSAVVWAYRDIYFTPSTTDYILSFDWKGMGETGYDYMNVYIGSPVIPIPATSSSINVPAGATTLFTNIGMQNSWQTVNDTLDAATYSATTKRIFFAWRNDGSDGDQPAIAVDNISITPVILTVCETPTNLQVPSATITDQSALVTWTPGGTETSWMIEYKLETAANWTSANAAQNSYSLQGLQPNTTYEVRVKALCTSDNSDFTAPVQFTTQNTTVVNYTINATATGDGSITPSGNIIVPAGSDQTFTFTPNSGNMVTLLTVNGTVLANPGTEYTFTNVQNDQTIEVQFGVGINDTQFTNLVSIYPNPTSDIMEISINLSNLTVLNAAIYDMYGKVINHISIYENLTQISVNHLSSGVYFLQINTDKGIVTKKFIKK